MRVRLFAVLREQAGTGEVTDATGRSVGELADVLSARFGERFAAVAGVSSFVVNGERATRATPVADGDEVAILPPVSGGSGGVILELPAGQRRSARPLERRKGRVGGLDVRQARDPLEERRKVADPSRREISSGGCEDHRPDVGGLRAAVDRAAGLEDGEVMVDGLPRQQEIAGELTRVAPVAFAEVEEQSKLGEAERSRAEEGVGPALEGGRCPLRRDEEGPRIHRWCLPPAADTQALVCTRRQISDSPRTSGI